MSDSAGKRRRRAAVLVVMAGVCSVPWALSAYQTGAAPPPASAEVATAETVPALRREIDLLKAKVDEQAARLRREIEDHPKPAWIAAAPWAALTVVGVWSSTAWFVLNWRERRLKWRQLARPKTLERLVQRVEDIDGQLTRLGVSLDTMSHDVTSMTESIRDGWKAVAISRITAGDAAPRA